MASNFTSKNISSISLENIIYNLKSVPFHATAAEWELAPLNAYVPKQGEMVVYDKDDENAVERLKIGDGVSTVSNLPFAVPEYEVITPEMIVEMIGQTDAAQPIADADNNVLMADDEKVLML